jgi:DNA replication protein
MSDFSGFAGIAKATAIPNVFFTTVLPDLEQPAELLAFLWLARFSQDRSIEARFATASELLVFPGVQAAFEHLGGGIEALEPALDSLARRHVLLALDITGPAGPERLYFVNTPAARRAVARARAGDLQLRPTSIVLPPTAGEDRPNIFRLYEEQIGTITPMVGDRLIEAEERYPREWVEDAFREAAELNVRSWRYIERILLRWAEEGRAYETAGRDPVEDDKQHFLGGFEHLIHRR